MPNNVLITGAPGIGKTTLIKHLIRDLAPVIVRGFYKEAIFENNIIKGYRLVTTELHEQILAHVYFESPEKIGNFGVNINGLNKLVDRELNLNSGTELFIIDEIGRMECLSEQFCRQIHEILDSDVPLIASVAQIVTPELKVLKERKDITLVQVTQKNRETLWKNILLKV
jgi:nucleoside-triphosphatase